MIITFKTDPIVIAETSSELIVVNEKLKSKEM
jgi:hypothetical protein